jgi:hypothetical protein
MSQSCSLSDPNHPFVKDAPRHCQACGAALCLRKQVLNLALGNTDEMFCLVCLSQQSDESPDELLKSLMVYVKQRDCFNKEWRRYTGTEFCPDLKGCYPGICFEQNL